jgi:hypothetical protein
LGQNFCFSPQIAALGMVGLLQLTNPDIVNVCGWFMGSACASFPSDRVILSIACSIGSFICNIARVMHRTSRLPSFSTISRFHHILQLHCLVEEQIVLVDRARLVSPVWDLEAMRVLERPWVMYNTRSGKFGTKVEREDTSGTL